MSFETEHRRDGERFNEFTTLGCFLSVRINTISIIQRIITKKERSERDGKGDGDIEKEEIKSKENERKNRNTA